MRKRRLVAALLAATLLSLTGCGSEPSGRERPPNVPLEAFWLGGSEGGCFVRITKEAHDPANAYRAHIYGPSGDTWYEGMLSVPEEHDPRIDLDDPRVFSGWDGEALHLADGRKLLVAR